MLAFLGRLDQKGKELEMLKKGSKFWKRFLQKIANNSLF